MQGGAVRVIRRAPAINHSQTILLVLIFLMPIYSPVTNVSADTRVSADDFQILEEMTDVLSQREDVISSELVKNIAGPSLEGVENSVTPTNQDDPESPDDNEDIIEEVVSSNLSFVGILPILSVILLASMNKKR